MYRIDRTRAFSESQIDLPNDAHYHTIVTSCHQAFASNAKFWHPSIYSSAQPSLTESNTRKIGAAHDFVLKKWLHPMNLENIALTVWFHRDLQSLVNVSCFLKSNAAIWSIFRGTECYPWNAFWSSLTLLASLIPIAFLGIFILPIRPPIFYSIHQNS